MTKITADDIIDPSVSPKIKEITANLIELETVITRLREQGVIIQILNSSFETPS